jgi:hypothetical protein
LSWGFQAFSMREKAVHVLTLWGDEGGGAEIPKPPLKGRHHQILVCDQVIGGTTIREKKIWSRGQIHKGRAGGPQGKLKGTVKAAPLHTAMSGQSPGCCRVSMKSSVDNMVSLCKIINKWARQRWSLWEGPVPSTARVRWFECKVEGEEEVGSVAYGKVGQRQSGRAQ